jgi:hypothetical protein
MNALVFFFFGGAFGMPAKIVRHIGSKFGKGKSPPAFSLALEALTKTDAKKKNTKIDALIFFLFARLPVAAENLRKRPKVEVHVSKRSTFSTRPLLRPRKIDVHTSHHPIFFLPDYKS